MDTNNVFKIVTAYENFTAALRAETMAGRLVAQLESEHDGWPFELLAVERVREHAAIVAAEANMIVIAARSQAELPAGVQDWIERWLAQKSFAPAALVALLDGEGKAMEEPPLLCAYLNQIAERGNMEFFCNLDAWRRQADVRTGLRHSEPGGALPEEALPEYAAIRGWGINE